MRTAPASKETNDPPKPRPISQINRFTASAPGTALTMIHAGRT
ncbi:hypothetical protein [Nonomuraea sp. NPDC050691]